MKITKKNWMRINQILKSRNIDPSQFKHIDCIRRHPTESAEHFMAKVEECNRLYELGHPYLTEVWTLDHKKRFDILDLEDDIDTEIETGKSKNKTYKGDKVIET